MRIILKQDVLNLGRAGDIKEVKNGYARNFLIPKGLVMSADARSEKQKAFLERVQERKTAKRKKTAEETAKTISGKEFAIVMKVGEGKLYGSVTNILVSKELLKQGFTIERKNIQLEEPIKTLGIFDIEIKFYEGISAQIKIRVQDEEGNIELIEPDTSTDSETEEEVVADVSDTSSGSMTDSADPVDAKESPEAE